MSIASCFTRFTFYFLIYLLFCTAAADVLQNGKTTGTGDSQNDTAEEALFQKTFTQLRGMFHNQILDEDFKTLKQVTNSKVYLDFLKQAYSVDKPFQTLDEFITAAPPVTEKYQGFLKEHFEKLTDTDFVNVHQLTLAYRRADMILIHAEQTKKRSDIESALQEKVKTFQKAEINAWWASRFSGKDDRKKMAFLLRFEKFVTETEKIDTDWIQTQFETHGQSDGLLWTAIRKPLLIGEILANCSSTDAFLIWVEQTMILKKLAEFEKL